jgi:hypothetical protein
MRDPAFTELTFEVRSILADAEAKSEAEEQT